MSFVLTVTVLLVLLVVFPPTFWIGSRVAVRTDVPTVWLRRLIASLWGVAALSYLAFLAVGAGDLGRNAVTTYVPIGASSIVGDVAAQLTICLAAAGVTLATYATLVPAIRDVREIDLPLGTAVFRLGRYAVAFAAFISVLFVLFFRTLLADGATFTAMVLPALIVVLALANPYLVRVFRKTRSPDPAERERLERLRERVGLSVGDIVVLDDADETLEIHVRGVPGRRRLFVSEYLLGTFDDETIEALLAVHAGTLRSHHRGLASYSVLGFLVVAIGALLSGSGSAVTAVILLAIVLPLPTLWAARRALFRADDYASGTVGTETVARALERSATEQNVDIVRGGFWYLLKTRPPLGRRIDRLRND